MLDEETKSSLSSNIKAVREAIESCKTAQSVTLMLATKTVDAERIAYAVRECGITDIGENRVQELLDKYDELSVLPCRLHFIGSLQKNKVKYLVGRVDLIQSVDSESLAAEIDSCAHSRGVIQDILVEVNIGREENKGGVMPEETEGLIEKISGFSGIRVRGLMTMAPKCENDADYQKYFSQIYQLFIDICEKKSDNIIKPVLSMGMSDSYRVATACGATMVRVGSAIFGKREYPTKR